MLQETECEAGVLFKDGVIRERNTTVTTPFYHKAGAGGNKNFLISISEDITDSTGAFVFINIWT